MLKEINENQYNEIISKRVSCVIFVGNDQCTTCKALELMIEEVQKKYKFRMWKIDSIKNQDFVENFLNIKTVPTFIFIKQGLVIGFANRNNNIEDIKDMIKKVLKGE